MIRDGLVAQHHADQRTIARNVVADLMPLWNILDFHRLPDTTPAWLAAVKPVIERGYLTSQYQAAQFYQNLRSQVIPAAPAFDLDVPNPLGPFGITAPADAQTAMRILVSMKVTGPLSVAKQTMPGVDLSEADELMATGFRKSAGAAIRLVLNGGRGMVRTLVQADQAALGVGSVATENSCDTCKFLASQRILKVTHTPRQMDAVAIGHDACGCVAIPIF